MISASGSELHLTREPALRRYWCPVALTEDVTADPVARRLLGTDVVLWRPAPGEIAAAVDRCPHRFARLSCGWVDDCALVCPYHGWEFAADGRARRIPQLDDAAHLPPRAHLDMLPAAERYGWIWVCLDPSPALPIPELASYGAPGWRAVHEPTSEWACPAPMIIENNLDPGHIAFVHRASFGILSQAALPSPHVERTDAGVRSSYEVAVQARPGEQGLSVRRTTAEVHGPFLMTICIEYPDGLTHVIVKACTPVDDTSTLQLQTVLRTDTDADCPVAEIVGFDAQVWDEDRAVLETAHHDYPMDLTAQVHVRTDRPAIEYRRMLAGLVGRAETAPTVP